MTQSSEMTQSSDLPDAVPDRHRGTGREVTVILVLSLTFGLVSFDRFVIAPLFPFISKDLHFNYTDLGLLVGALGIAWGFSAPLAGWLSDKFGRRIVLVPAAIVFLLLSFTSGLAMTLAEFVLIRIIIGISEGAFFAPSAGVVTQVSAPKRLGLTQGLYMTSFALFGSALAPVIATQLMEIVHNWRYVFFLTIIPGLILVPFLWHLIPEPPHLQGKARPTSATRRHWRYVLRSRNLRVAVICEICCEAFILTLAVMLPSYFIRFLHYKPTDMGFVVSALGLGGVLGEFMVPWASDYLGRRFVAISAMIIPVLSISLFLIHPDASKPLLFASLFISAFFPFGLLGFWGGTVASEAVDATNTALACGLVSGTAAIFGGGIAPYIVGRISDAYGIQTLFYLPMAALVIGVVVAALFLRETAPRALARQRETV